MTNRTDAEKQAIGTVPPGRPLGQTSKPDVTVGGSGPTSPGSPEPESNSGPESGGYDNRPATPMPDNAKGGYGAG